ncbi:hypothetical protein [Sphaerimonospora thailandensis]|uniref:Uncharacterized protein n=1 Tax=Sphaerimonospora thailandensis TaxID=795644 RepID=A0A8J3R3R8_9ACTN|nr:hypothetical protein [Sphaerimonospora thailandensis]GIH68681.1 hypothetical protein Mth01_09340 [Sphaerimonospora thailandensis]
MSGEVVFIAAYAVALLVVATVLEIYGRQPTSAWASRVFAGYRRAVPDAPGPADPEDWPHSEASRFHQVVSLFVTVVAVALVAGELVRHHRPFEALTLIAAGSAHGLLAARIVRRLRHARASRTTGPTKREEDPVVENVPEARHRRAH